MLPMGDLFYGRAEPVWILNHARDDSEDEEEQESSRAKKSETEDYSTSSTTNEAPVTTSPYYPYYSPYSSYPHQPRPYYFARLPSNSYDDVEEKEVMMKVPICCSECEDSIKVPLKEMKGVKSVECNIRTKKVTVVVTTAAPAGILVECRKVFKRSRMWTDDD